MINNLGTIDKSIRITITVVIAILYFTGLISGMLAIVLGILALVFIITSLMSYCPLYQLVGINTCKKEDANKATVKKIK